MPTYRPAITGSRHMISAGHYSAAHAGFQILEAGGNAIDAGVAAGIAVSVLQTDRVNFAGVAPISKPNIAASSCMPAAPGLKDPCCRKPSTCSPVSI